MKKLIFIFENFFIERDFDRFGIQFFLDNKIDVEVWDITEFCNKNFDRLVKPVDEAKGDYIKKFKNAHDIKIAFNNLKNTSLFAVYINININTLLIFRLLTKHKIKYFLHSGPLYSSPVWAKRSFLKRIKTFFNKSPADTLEYFQNMLLRIFSPRLFGISYIPIYFKDNKAADNTISLKKKLIGRSTKIIQSHHRDYDLYLKHRHKNNDDEKYRSDAVLIDQNFGFHNDQIRVGEVMEPEKWYKSLKIFFDFLKNKYSIKTTFCAHPRSGGEMNSLISGYPIIKNKTPQLVKNCSFVICQSTTAINFAVLFKKPMIFIYNHIHMKIKNPKLNAGEAVRRTASLFNKKPINIESLSDFNLEKELKIDENSYDRYRTEYIKSWGSDKTVDEIIKELL